MTSAEWSLNLDGPNQHLRLTAETPDDLEVLASRYGIMLDLNSEEERAEYVVLKSARCGAVRQVGDTVVRSDGVEAGKYRELQYDASQFPCVQGVHDAVYPHRDSDGDKWFSEGEN